MIVLLKKRFLIVLLVVVLLMSTIVYSSNALTVQQLFPNYNVVSGTVISQTQLRGAPCASTTTNPVYFYSIHISSGTNVYVLEKDNGYYYIAYQNPSDNKYYTGYVPISNVSCSGASWCNYDVYWTAEAKTSYSSVICGPGAQTYFPVISVIHYNLPTESVDVTVLKTVGNFFFIQYRIQGQLVRGWVLQAAVTVYSANGSGKNNDYFAFVGQYKKCEYNERDSSENTVYIINCNTNLALTVNNTATGTIVTAEPFTGSLKQEFSLVFSPNYIN